MAVKELLKYLKEFEGSLYYDKEHDAFVVDAFRKRKDNYYVAFKIKECDFETNDPIRGNLFNNYILPAIDSIKRSIEENEVEIEDDQ